MTFKETLLALMDAHREPLLEKLNDAYNCVERIEDENHRLERTLDEMRATLNKMLKENAPAGTGAEEPCDQPNGKDTQ